MTITTTAITPVGVSRQDKRRFDITVKLTCKDNGAVIIDQPFSTSWQQGEVLNFQIGLLRDPMQDLINKVKAEYALIDGTKLDAPIANLQARLNF